MAEGGQEHIDMDNNAVEPGETNHDKKAKSSPRFQLTPLTSQSVDTSSEIIDHAEDFDNRIEMTTNINPVSGALLLRHQKQTEDRRRLEPEDVQVEPSASTSSSSEVPSSNLSEQQIDLTPQDNNSAEAAEQSTKSTQHDSDHVDPAEVALSMTERPISERPSESGTDQSEDYTTADVRTPPTPPQPPYEHTAPTTLSEESPYASSYFEDEDSLPVTTEASGRGSRVADSGDEGDGDLPTEPIQPESLLFIDDRGILRVYEHKIEWHTEGVPESEQIAQMIEKLIFAFHKQPSYREELKKMLGDAQTDNIWPDIPDNIDITIPPDATDYFEDFKLDLVNLGEMHLTSSKEAAQNTLSLLCTNHVSLVTGCLIGKLSFSNKSFGYFLANFVGGKLSMDLKRAVFSKDFFRSFKCPPDLKIDGVGEISLEEQKLAERVLKMLIKQHLRVQVFMPYKYISECISEGGLGELPISISTMPIEQPKADKSHLIKKLRTEFDVDVKLKGVFSLCYPDPEALKSDFELLDKSQFEKFLVCDDECTEINAQLKMLPCQHKLCGSCLSKWKKNSSEKKCYSCGRKHEEEIHKLIICCPVCKKEHDVRGEFDDSQHSLEIAKVINHPTYSQLKSEPEPQPKTQDNRSSEEINSTIANDESYKMPDLLERIFVGDFVEIKDEEVNIGDSKEVGVLIHVNDHNGTVEVVFPSVSGWHGNISELTLSSCSSDLPVKGDVVKFIDDTVPGKPVHGYNKNTPRTMK